MTDGHVIVHGTFLGIVAVGFSYQHCFFVPDDGGGETVIPERGPPWTLKDRGVKPSRLDVQPLRQRFNQTS